jgi:hypothetical protein
MPSRSFRTRTAREPHRCCGARVSIGAYGDWHLCEACEMLPSERHLHRGARITRVAETERKPTKRAGRSRPRR